MANGPVADGSGRRGAPTADPVAVAPHVGRRAVLRGAATSGLALPLLAACSAGTPASGSPSHPASHPASSGPTAAGSPSGAGAAGGGAEAHPGSRGGRRHVLASTSDVPVGGGTILSSHRIVLTQPSKGSFEGFSAVCTHAGCLVSSVQDGTIDCPCHGSRFSISDGSVVAGPAPSALPRVRISVQGGTIARA